jgi:conjugal transfer mating pair stabilization protein TraN
MTDSCLASAGCPYGDQFTCMPNTDTGKFQCSPYECVNVAAGEGVELEPFSEDYLQDDGERDAEGNCLGQLYIFNGKPSRCRTPGWTVGYINNCCDSGDMMPEDMGSGVGMVAGAYGLYRGGAAAYQAYQGFDFGQQLLTLGADSAAVTQGATNYIAQSVSTGAVSPQAAQAFVDGANSAAAGATSASGTMLTSFARGVGAAVVTYAVGALAEEAGMGQDDVIGAQAAAMTAMIYAGMLSGPQAAFGIVVIVVMRLLMGTGCDVNDIMTSNDLKSKRCHYIGTYCEKKILSMCVQKAKGHCCFNSILARIIHQQGRPQLTSFQPAGAWGPAKRPNCRGFTPEEFQSLDFSKIDMSEYYQQVMVDIEERVQGASTRVESTIRGRFDQIQEGM